MHENSFDLILIFPIFLLCCVILTSSVNIFMFIKNKFPVKVNCWFCNQWTKVPHNRKNSFECPTCLQYNGFTATGDYNKLLPAQHDISLNKSFDKNDNNESKFSSSNGLCRLCNNNQKLRVFQLANFIPLNEANYDTEIEHFQQQLDKAYKLCRQCENTVKATILKQNSLLGINVKAITSKGLSLIDLTQNTNGISTEQKQTYLKKFVFCAIISLSLLNVIRFLNRNEVVSDILDKFLWLPLSSCSLKVQNIFLKYFKSNAIESASHLQNFESVFMIWEYPLITDVLFILQLIWMNVVDVLSLFSLPSFFIFTHTEFCLYFVGALMQFIWLILNYGNGFKKNVFLLVILLTILPLELGYLFPDIPYTNVIKLAANILNIILMCILNDHKKINRKKPNHAPKPRNKRNNSIEAVRNKKPILTSGAKNKSKINQVTTKLPVSKQNLFCDVSTVTPTKGFGQTFTENLFSNSIDLDVSLNKLHIGTAAPKKSPFKTSYICTSPNLDRPRPVVSPAKFQVLTPNSRVPGDFSRSSNILLPNFTKPNSQITEVSRFVPSNQNNLNSHNNFCDDLDYNSFFSPPMFNVSPPPQGFGNHFNACYPRYSCGHHYNSTYQPIINNEQLVYISPNYLPSRNVYQILRENFSTAVFDAGFAGNAVNKQKYSTNCDSTDLSYNQCNKKFR